MNPEQLEKNRLVEDEKIESGNVKFLKENFCLFYFE
jgi:hypothetical protein